MPDSEIPQYGLFETTLEAVSKPPLAEEGRQYIAYARGIDQFILSLAPDHTYDLNQFDPRTGTFTPFGNCTGDSYTYALPDDRD